MKRYFITGTNTDCGKTYTTTKWLDFHKKQGMRAAAIKPVACGAREINSALVSDDSLLLQAGSRLPLTEISPWTFARPASPHIASKEINKIVTAQEIADYCTNYSPEQVDFLLIEGAGGLMVPINDNETWVDVLQLAKISIVLVVGITLGCINHALLTQIAMEKYGLDCVGWIANCLDETMLSATESIATLASQLKFPLLGTLAFGGEWSRELNV